MNLSDKKKYKIFSSNNRNEENYDNKSTSSISSVVIESISSQSKTDLDDIPSVGSSLSSTKTSNDVIYKDSWKQVDEDQLNLDTKISNKWNLLKQNLNDIKNMENNSNNHLHDVYTELEELTINDSANDSQKYEWKVISRWIKYEQTIDQETLNWNEPFIGALIYQSLIYLKNTLQYSTILLNSNSNTFEEIVDEVINDFVDRGHLSRDNKETLKLILISQHRCQDSLISKNLTEHKHKHKLSELYSSKYNKTKSVKLHSSSSFASNLAKSSSFVFGNNNTSNKIQRNKSTEEFINLNEITKTELQPRFSIAEDNTLEDHNHHHHHHHHHLNLRASIHHLKRSLVKTASYHSHSQFETDVESFLIMVGVIPTLDRPLMGFVRLENVQSIGLVDSEVHVRFLFIFMGPKRSDFDYTEVGRCMGLMMTNLNFRKCAYTAKNRQELIRGITDFNNKSLSIVLPINDDVIGDQELLKPVIDWLKEQIQKKAEKKTVAKQISSKRHNVQKLNQNETESFINSNTNNNNNKSTDKVDPFHRTGIPFGCLYYETKNRYSKYVSDIKDGFNFHCFISFIFIFTVCFTPALCFAGILEHKTNHWFGLNEVLIATCINGMIFALFSGQPLIIFGATGPFLVFEEFLYIVCVEYMCVEFFATRIWISLWILLFSVLMLAFELINLVNFITRFTEEIFAFLIAFVFLADCIKKVIEYFIKYPMYTLDKYCYVSNSTNLYNNITSYSSIMHNQTMNTFSCVASSNQSQTNDYQSPKLEPNKALLSLIYMIATCYMALILKKLRRSTFFSSYVRRTLSDVGILISIIFMVLVDSLIKSKTNIDIQKLQTPMDTLNSSFANMIRPTKDLRKTWLISPFGNNDFGESNFPIWVPFASFLPAIVIFIVLFFEIELTGNILMSKSRNLKKGSGFNIDLLLGSLMMVLNSLLGLPWLCAAPVQTLAHWASLTVFSSSFIPGDKPRLVLVREQRLTGFFVHLAIGLCIYMRSILVLIPVPVLFGIFLYFGIVSLSGTQLYERIKLLFIPLKYSPHMQYARGVRSSKRNLFTILQIIIVFILLVFKSFPLLSWIFPLILVLLVITRKFFLPKIFSSRELDQLDCHYEDENEDIIHDFYELTHLPI